MTSSLTLVSIRNRTWLSSLNRIFTILLFCLVFESITNSSLPLHLFPFTGCLPCTSVQINVVYHPATLHIIFHIIHTSFFGFFDRDEYIPSIDKAINVSMDSFRVVLLYNVQKNPLQWDHWYAYYPSQRLASISWAFSFDTDVARRLFSILYRDCKNIKRISVDMHTWLFGSKTKLTLTYLIWSSLYYLIIEFQTWHQRLSK